MESLSVMCQVRADGGSDSGAFQGNRTRGEQGIQRDQRRTGMGGVEVYISCDEDICHMNRLDQCANGNRGIGWHGEGFDVAVDLNVWFQLGRNVCWSGGARQSVSVGEIGMFHVV